MSEWKKVEEPVAGPSLSPDTDSPSAADAAAETAASPAAPRTDLSVEPAAEERPTATDAANPADSEEAGTSSASARVPEKDESPAALPGEDQALSSRRYTRGGKRKGHFRFAAPLGLLVLLLALTGVVSLVVVGVQAIQRATDDTDLKTELCDFLEPLTNYYPIESFDHPDDSQQDALMLAAIWKVTEAERIRMLREDAETSQYALDDNGRMVIPLEEIEASYASLFGSDAVPYLHTIGEEDSTFTTFEYDEAAGCYYVPSSFTDSIYQAVPDTLKKKGRTYTLRMGYVPLRNIGVDEKGDPVEATVAMATEFQTYTLEKTDTGWKIVSVSASTSTPS